MKRRLIMFLTAILLMVLAMPTFAVSSVPEPVLAATESVVRVLAEYSDGYATGSGFVIKSNSNETLIATNYHVVEGNPYNISIWISENETVSAHILACTNQKDMCVLTTAYPLTLEPLVLDATGAKQGEAVYAVGFPGAADYLSDTEAHTSTDATITDGIVSAVRTATVSQYGTPTSILQINAAINSGNSGGPLFNVSGKVVGINTYGINDSQGIFGSIDVSELKVFLADHSIELDNSIVKTPWLVLALIAGAVLLLITIMIINKVKKNKQPTQPKTYPSLREYMAAHSTGLGMNDAVALLLPIALQLRDLHNNGSTHLQVSPDTVFVSDNGAQLEAASGEEHRRYTSGYAAPEIYREKPAGNLSDIYSFCALLYYVATGNQLENAIARADSLKDEIDANQLDDFFKETVRKGVALNAEERFPSMQEIIIKLSPYNVQPFANKAVPAEPSAPVAVKKQRNASVSPKVAIISLVILLLIAVPCTYLGCYLGARNNIANGEWETAERLLFVPQITKLHDPQLLDYLEANELLVKREYSEAKHIFDAISGYMDADILAQEADYRYAMQCADANDFDNALTVMANLRAYGYKDSTEKSLEFQYRKAVYLLYEKKDFSEANKIFEELVRKGYENAAEMQKETQYLWACSYIEKDEYIAAYRKMDTIRGYSDVNNILINLQEVIYNEGQEYYHKGNYFAARDCFTCISTHSDSDKYLALIAARINISNDTLTHVLNLINYFYFEDAADLLLSNQAFGEIFLLGTWENEGYYFTMKEGGGTSYNLPWFDYGDYYRIEDGDILLYPENNENDTKTLFSLTAITPDCIEVFCYKDYKSYTLYRE